MKGKKESESKYRHVGLLMLFGGVIKRVIRMVSKRVIRVMPLITPVEACGLTLEVVTTPHS